MVVGVAAVAVAVVAILVADTIVGAVAAMLLPQLLP